LSDHGSQDQNRCESVIRHFHLGELYQNRRIPGGPYYKVDLDVQTAVESVSAMTPLGDSCSSRSIFGLGCFRLRRKLRRLIALGLRIGGRRRLRIPSIRSSLFTRFVKSVFDVPPEFLGEEFLHLGIARHLEVCHDPSIHPGTLRLAPIRLAASVIVDFVGRVRRGAGLLDRFSCRGGSR
jgi:hypothetical protein